MYFSAGGLAQTCALATVLVLLGSGESSAAPRRKPPEKAPEPAAAAPVPAPAEPVAPPAPPPAPAPPPPSKPAKVDEDRIAVAVMEVKTSPNMTAELATALGDVIPQELDDLGSFRTITRNDIVKMVQFEQVKQLLGCDEAACLTELGGALGADYLVNGSVLLLGDAYVVQFTLIKMSASRVVQRVSREYRGNLTGLLAELRLVARMLVRDLTATHAGTLRFKVSEEGATVKVDGSIVGVSPVADVSTSGGVHAVSVEKQSFVLFQKDVKLAKNGTEEVVANLVPSAEFKRDYIAAANRQRFIGWTVLGAGVAALAGGGALYAVSGSQAESLSADVAAFNADPASRTKELEAELNGRRRRVGLFETLTLVSAGVGIAGLATGTVLLLTGDDPHRFDAVSPPDEAPTARIDVGLGTVTALVRF